MGHSQWLLYHYQGRIILSRRKTRKSGPGTIQSSHLSQPHCMISLFIGFKKLPGTSSLSMSLSTLTPYYLLNSSHKTASIIFPHSLSSRARESRYRCALWMIRSCSSRTLWIRQSSSKCVQVSSITAPFSWRAPWPFPRWTSPQGLRETGCPSPSWVTMLP